MISITCNRFGFRVYAQNPSAKPERGSSDCFYFYPDLSIFLRTFLSIYLFFILQYSCLAKANPDNSCLGFKEIVAGDNHTCARLSSGKVMCWGDNSYGQLGRGGTGSSSGIPKEVQNLSHAQEIAVGWGHTCARLSSGKVMCWGRNSSGQLGRGGTGSSSSSGTPKEVKNLSHAQEIATGDNHTCARLSSGKVRCWGDNSSGQLGRGGTGSSSGTPKEVKNLSRAQEIVAGGSHTCARLGNKKVMCWGYNGYGQLGRGGTGSSSSSGTPKEVKNLSHAQEIVAGGSHTCARLSSGKVMCWGYNSSSQLGRGGIGSISSSGTPKEVQNLSHAQEIAAGRAHTCARVGSGKVMCWGANSSGQLGRGSTGSSFGTPKEVKNLSHAQEVAVGGSHTCVRVGSGKVMCWGANSSGQLGRGSTGSSFGTPKEVQNLSHAQEIAVGWLHTCARVGNKKVMCWGANSSGQLGRGGTGSSSSSGNPKEVQNLSHAQEIAVGWLHTCARVGNKKVMCWGANSYGQLGRGDIGSSFGSGTPKEVQNLSHAQEIVAGGSHTCARLGSGKVMCWGYNSSGQLGRGGTGSSFGIPKEVQNLSHAQEIAVGRAHTCARVGSGKVMCWGDNSFGQLGRGSIGSSSGTPKEVQNLSHAQEIAVGGSHTCARLSSGKVMCWGDNSYGQLGRGGTGSISGTPKEVQNLSHAQEIAVGGGHTCARVGNKKVMCWGDNRLGQLGRGGTGSISGTPKEVQNLSHAQEIVAGGSHTCARLGNKKVMCWGDNSSGQLGGPPIGTPGYISAVFCSNK